MGIINIRFKNVKSLENTFIDLEKLNVLIGKNGAGKTNIQKYLYYFYENLVETNIDNNIIDKNNPYNSYAEISVKFDLSKFIEIGNKSENIGKEFFNKISLLNENGDSSITLTFKQYKNNTILWSHDYQIRKLLKYLYPIYYIDVRTLDLYDWENIWDIIGEFGQRRSEKEEEFTKEFDGILKKIYGTKYFEYLVQLKSEIDRLEYNVQSYSNSEKFKQIYKLKFGGDKFNFKKNKLNFYSKGYNSYNYLRIFYTVLDLLHNSKVKNPIVILDEPEIGLHPNLIDELMQLIAGQNKVIQTILATHSPRVLKNSLVTKDVNIFQLTEINFKTSVRKIMNLENKKSHKVISDKEASYYFANGILFVEGVTEFELFSNEYLQNLYPILKEIEVFTYNSNNISLDVSHPFQRNLDIPYLLLLDMDKIIKYDNDKKQFSISGDTYNPLKNLEIIKREKFLYGERRILLHYRNRIKGISNKVNFNYDENKFVFSDKLFYEYRALIKAYCKNYNVYPVNTTIEGSVVNKSNYTYFYQWIMGDGCSYSDKVKLKEAYDKNDNISYKINILKTIIEGNLEPLFRLNEKRAGKSTTQSIKEGYQIAIKLEKLQKGSGWMTLFIDDIFSGFKKDNQKSQFSILFPEIADIIKTLEVIMK
ncbi:retron Eco8 family effector endonuclease [Psychrobacillus sp. INOP01]|uniref:retron Eco8 family effector endonuclease n=1 Tax=Psychrobacillus sp. INOP01 TaxID=2829187 RepID=UPI001BADC1C1|nr:retron Eco8 family effector endonuclease [Psychrobacillus sp. INOP01]QUG43051.1 retron Eco8 family effector endonuclease [Psychrobacillus sp. INOP01]